MKKTLREVPRPPGLKKNENAKYVEIKCEGIHFQPWGSTRMTILLDVPAEVTKNDIDEVLEYYFKNVWGLVAESKSS